MLPTKWRLQPELRRDLRAWRPTGEVVQEVAVYALPLLIHDMLRPRRVIPAAPPSALGLAGEVVASLCMYDAYFFVGHAALHVVPALAPYHAKHHYSRIVRARDVVRLSVLEEALDVGCSIAALNTVGAHPLSRAVFNVVIIYLLCELHCGYDFPWSLQNVVPFGVWQGSRRHTAHHVHGRAHFAKFLSVFDGIERWILARVPALPLQDEKRAPPGPWRREAGWLWLRGVGRAVSHD